MPGRVDEGGNLRDAGALPRNPIPTVDIIIALGDGIVLIERANPPHGWALPGGFIDYGETAEDAAAREALEETGLAVAELKQFGVYSDPERDPRMHTLTVVFTAVGYGTLRAGDDAAAAAVSRLDELPEKLVFDHRRILDDYIRSRDDHAGR